MAGTFLRRLLLVPIALLAWGFSSPALSACDFCNMQGQTLTDEVNQAGMVLYGNLSNAKLDPDGGSGQGTTDLRIEAVIKKHEVLGDQKTITLPRYLPSDGNNLRFLIFCDVVKGKVDPYRGVPVKAPSDMVKYLEGALGVKDKEIASRLRYYFQYLDNPDIEISTDAYKVFGNADYKDYREMAKDLPADKIARWLQDPDTPDSRRGLYASMLGHCGNASHAVLMHKLLDDAQKKATPGVDGMLAGYTMLKPEEGWAYVRGIYNDPSKDFGVRYAALRAGRFFWNTRPDLVDRKKVLEGVCLLLDDPNIADLAIEDLRKWGRWDVSERVLGLYDKPTHDVPIMHRAILKYALSCPDEKAASLVAKVRQKDPEMVTDTEELLKLETPAPVPRPAAGAGN